MLLMLHAGLRSEEVRALQAKDLDFEKNCVTVNKAVKRTGELGTTKNGKSRIVPLPIAIMKSFTRISSLPGETYIVGEGKIYCTRDGFRSRYHSFFSRMNAHLKAPVPFLPPHCTRHTYSTILQRKGLPMPIVAALLGHSSIQVTQGYTHLDGFDDLRRAVDGLMSD